MKKLGTIVELKYKEFFEYLKSINNRSEIFWNPNTCIWGKEFSLYNLHINKKLSQELRNAFSNAIIHDNLSDYKVNTIKNKIELFLNTNTPIPYVYRNKYLTVLNFSGDLQVILNEFIKVKELKNINNIKSNQVFLCVDSICPEMNTNVPEIIRDKSIDDINIELEQKKNELEKIKEENYNKIEELRKEQEKQLQALKDELYLKEYELQVKKEELLDQIFIIEDKIYDLRIIFGEAFDVVNITKGKRCDIERPVVIYQKFRYLEDEIVRLSTLRAEYFTGEHNQIEKFLANCPELVETLCPNEKCVTICRMTENDKYYVKNLAKDICETIETLHGKQLCILIRDGNNLDIVWVDEDIMLKDNLFVTKGVSLNKEEILTDESKLRSPEFRIVLNRKYLLLILQVLVKENIISLPEDVNILKNNKYIIFSDADKLLDINKYPKLDEYVYQCNKIENCKVGDQIIVVQKASGSNYSYNGYRREYSHYRGNGYEDRVHDAYLKVGLNKINLLIYKDPDNRWSENEIFVSCVKEYSDKGARANVRIYSDEFINLTFISSNHIRYWINTKKIGGNFSALNYAQICTFLKDALEVVIEREKQEFELINTLFNFEYNSNNIDKLTEWKFNNKIRKIHKMNVRKFIGENCG